MKIEKEFWIKFRPKLIGLVAANILMWVACNTFYKMPFTFSVLFSTFTLIFLLFFVVQDLNLSRGGDIVRFLLYYVLIAGGAVTGAIWIVSAKMGFPRMFVITIVAFAVLCLLLFFILEFKPHMRETTGLKTANNLLLFYLMISALYYITASALPQFEPANEIAKMKAAALKLTGLDKEGVIKAGIKVFKDFECSNCHNVISGADPKRGPVLNEIDLGDHANIVENLVDPYKVIKEPYASIKKVARSMPDYYGQQMSKDEIEAVVVYLEALKTIEIKEIPTDRMPDGWWTDEKVLAEGKKIFEGLFDEDVACHACHGKDGTPQMEEASDFRTSERLKKYTAARFFQIVKYGYDGESLMDGWGDYISDEQVWQVIAYTNIFPNGLKPAERPEPEGPDAIQVIKEKYWEE